MQDYCRSSADLLQLQMHLIMTIIGKCDAELFLFLERSEIQPYFALSWVVTWMSHVIDELSLVARLFDTLINLHPMLMLYVAAEVRV